MEKHYKCPKCGAIDPKYIVGNLNSMHYYVHCDSKNKKGKKCRKVLGEIYGKQMDFYYYCNLNTRNVRDVKLIEVLDVDFQVYNYKQKLLE